MPSRYETTEQVARRLGITVSLVRRYAREDRFHDPLIPVAASPLPPTA